MKNIFTASLLALLTSTTTSWALAHDKDHAHDHEHGAHQHGIATLDLAMAGTQLELTLTSPAANLVGFEHQAKTAAQLAKVNAMENTLKAPESLFRLTGGDCQPHKTSLSHPLKEAGSGKHRDVSATWQFTCRGQTPAQLDSAPLLKHFPGIRQLKVSYLVAGHQGAQTLTTRQPRLDLTR